MDGSRIMRCMPPPGRSSLPNKTARKPWSFPGRFLRKDGAALSRPESLMHQGKPGFPASAGRSGFKKACALTLTLFFGCRRRLRGSMKVRKRRLRRERSRRRGSDELNDCLEVPREAQLDHVVAGIVVTLDLVVFIADHEVRALRHAELESGLRGPGKFGG